MQYIAEDPIHVVVRNETPALYDTGGRMIAPVKRRLFAKFTRGVAPTWAVEIAEKTFELRKMHLEVTVQQWIAYYDSVEDQAAMGWTDEERKAIEEKLDGHHAAMLVERPRVAAPWPTYDETHHGKIAALAEELGLVSQALAYEADNKKRPSVIEALQELAPAPDPADEPQVGEQLIEA